MPKEPIVVNGDRVEYFQDQKKVVGSGNISINYKDMVLTCDKITVYLDTREGIAEGNVKITQKDTFFTGDKVNYNFDTGKSTIINGYVSAKPFYGMAREVDKLAAKDQANMERGYITTCDHDKPHYRVQARHVEIYLEDKIVAKHVLFFLGDVPVMYLPYYVQPLWDTKSSLTVTTGQKDEWGYYALTAYRIHLNDKNRADILLDYRGRKGFGEGINYYYDFEELGQGAMKYYYTNENADPLSFAYERSGDRKPRSRWQWRHRWNMDEEANTRAILEFNRLSDTTIIKDYFNTEYDELGPEPDNYLSIVTSKSNYTQTLLARKRFGKFYTVIERLPEYTLDILQQNIIPALPFLYYTGNISAVYLNETFNNSGTATVTSGLKDLNVVRIDNYNKFSYTAKLFKALNLTPYAGIRNTYYSRNRWGTTNQIRAVFDSGVSGSIKFYKIYDITTNILRLDLHKIRHVITPTATYFNMHQPTISPVNLNQFDSVDSLRTTNGVSLGLENRLQTKRYAGSELTSVDLATLQINTTYAFRLKKDHLAYKNHTAKFSSVDLQLELLPYSWLKAVGRMSVNPKNYATQTESFDIVASGGDKWSAGIGHLYEKTTEANKNNYLTTDLTYKINNKWRVRAYDRYNVDKSFEEQQYTIYRDLHCWRAEFTYSTRKHPHEVGFWIVFTLKAFPDYPVGYKRSYAQPQFGSTNATLGRYDTMGKGEERLVPSEDFMI